MASWTAQAAERAKPDFFLRTWHTEHGLPQNHGTAIVQTHEGYLWIGSPGPGHGSEANETTGLVDPGLSSGRLASGNGLLNMHRRLEELGGQCLVESTVGVGTTLRFVVSGR